MQRERFALIGFIQVKTDENLDVFKTIAKRTIKIQGQITTKLDGIINDPLYHKNF